MSRKLEDTPKRLTMRRRYWANVEKERKRQREKSRRYRQDPVFVARRNEWHRKYEKNPDRIVWRIDWQKKRVQKFEELNLKPNDYLSEDTRNSIRWSLWKWSAHYRLDRDNWADTYYQILACATLSAYEGKKIKPTSWVRWQCHARCMFRKLTIRNNEFLGRKYGFDF